MTAAVASVGLLLGAMQGQSVSPEDLVQLADEAHVDVAQLHEALVTVAAAYGSVDARQYLVYDGRLAPPAPPQSAAVERLLDCISWYESKHTPGATNPTSKAAGQYQFLWSTWAGTPQGRAGLSPYDPLAARAAARWMINQGRKGEWVPVARGLC